MVSLNDDLRLIFEHDFMNKRSEKTASLRVARTRTKGKTSIINMGEVSNSLA